MYSKMYHVYIKSTYEMGRKRYYTKRKWNRFVKDININHTMFYT